MVDIEGGDSSTSKTPSAAYSAVATPLTPLSAQPNSPMSPTHVLLHVTDDPRQFWKALVEPVPTIPGTKNSAQGLSFFCQAAAGR